MNIPEHLLIAYIERFCNRTDSWFRQRENSSQYIHIKPDMQRMILDGYEFIYMPVDTKLIKLICQGIITASWPAIDANGNTIWIGYDGDDLDGQLDKLQEFYRQYGWHLIRTKGRIDRDGHLYLLFNRPINAVDAIIFADIMANYAGVNIKKAPSDKGVERFPVKADSISQLRGPLCINRKKEAEHARDWIVGPPQDIIEQLNFLCRCPLNDVDKLEAAIREFKLRQAPKPIPRRQNTLSKSKLEPVMFDYAVKKTEAKSSTSVWRTARCPLHASHKHGDKNKSFGLKKLMMVAQYRNALLDVWKKIFTRH